MRSPLPPAVTRAIRSALTRAKRVPTSELIAWSRSRPIRHRTVLYESFAGNGALCNPEAIFRALLADPEFAGFAGERHPHDAVVGVGREVREDGCLVDAVARPVREPEQASFAAGDHVGEDGGLAEAAVG